MMGKNCSIGQRFPCYLSENTRLNQYPALTLHVMRHPRRSPRTSSSSRSIWLGR
ncbi:hypothetical protein KPSA3_07410 [Pseudomonas syringae pv. actinidiae]|uniref:Uncharacterized protein n=1 Tax=Pseudomonas syringae pv. actinidiae TaxID=103796 RepID=A0AAN4QD89_PSESF|nr:hypothetical protein KPSA3_07410 [Pseudomonas syringae pv. actinidiae]